jgi:hypothetical protein
MPADFSTLWAQWRELGTAYQEARRRGDDTTALAIADQIVTMVQPDLLKQVVARNAGSLVESFLRDFTLPGKRG